jgi:alpha-glucosidase (family GH31 glycosyl hydrolase)
MPKNWSVDEPVNVNVFLRGNDEIKVGDFINYETNNQMGWKKYKVVIGDDGKKGLKLIADYDSMMDDSTRSLVSDEEETDDDDTTTTSTPKTGGKRRRRRKTMRKTKRAKKSRRKRKTRRGKKY